MNLENCKCLKDEKDEPNLSQEKVKEDEEIQKQTANEIKRYLDKGKYAEDLKKYQGKRL